MLQQKRGIKQIELLAPARDLECGIAAIDHGADAVYIGAPKFGARKVAGNSLDDINQLVQYAHLFNARIYVAINTLLYDHELQEAEQLIHELYAIGVDAIIIQDMGILEMNLPPIEIHASTQTDNRTPAKVAFLEKSGFQQVVLARELNLEEIKEIRRQTSVPLEFFVHGALCVSYSGQCYMSHATTGRSANRGECSQPCRLPYSLETAGGKTILKDQHLISLKDLNNSDHLKELINAGITSFKVEGRLKDAAYVKNITAWYRKALDKIIDANPGLQRSSSGQVTTAFKPSPEKSFSRGFTTYFLNGRQKNIWSMHTPKSLGEKLGRVVKVNKDHFFIEDGLNLQNGDGLCFLNREKQLCGFRINVAEGNKIYADNISELFSGATLFRNHDRAFEKELENSKETRRIAVDVTFCETGSGVSLSLIDEDGITSCIEESLNKETANNPSRAMEQINQQLSKWGNTIFTPSSIKIDLSQPLFIPVSVINALRRELAATHQQKRIENYQRTSSFIKPTSHHYPEMPESFSLNISNHLAEDFYKRHGVSNIIPAFELNSPKEGARLMTTRHCVRYATDGCPKEKPGAKPENLIMRSGNIRYELRFDCKKCEMHIYTLSEEMLQLKS
ncbi:peptidase U32 family protein [Alkaliflexus imshenetskii]|uniref:peptidase U32 family protein n=1 Tax=Alkaliflexus imshenetskii TaxID=286730 RepID=UPI00047A10AB|nr:U32 family peptidase [Alkaliflexus imshenetskii]